MSINLLFNKGSSIALSQANLKASKVIEISSSIRSFESCSMEFFTKLKVSLGLLKTFINNLWLEWLSQVLLKVSQKIFNFEISKEDISKIEKLNDGFRIGMNPNEVYEHPEIIRDWIVIETVISLDPEF